MKSIFDLSGSFNNNLFGLQDALKATFITHTHSFTQNNNISNLRNGVKSSCTWRGIWWGRLEGVIYWQDPAGAGTMKKKINLTPIETKKLHNSMLSEKEKESVYIASICNFFVVANAFWG